MRHKKIRLYTVRNEHQECSRALHEGHIDAVIDKLKALTSSDIRQSVLLHQDDNGESLLHLAARLTNRPDLITYAYDCLGAADFLVAVKLCDKSDNTPLHTAAAKSDKGLEKLVQCLLTSYPKHKADVEEIVSRQNKYGNTFLHEMVRRRSSGVVEALLLQLLPPEDPDHRLITLAISTLGCDNQTVLHAAVQNSEHQDVILKLLGFLMGKCPSSLQGEILYHEDSDGKNFVQLAAKNLSPDILTRMKSLLPADVYDRCKRSKGSAAMARLESSTADKQLPSKKCMACGKEMHIRQRTCPSCKTTQPDPKRRKEERLNKRKVKGSESKLKTGYIAKQFDNLIAKARGQGSQAFYFVRNPNNGYMYFNWSPEEPADQATTSQRKEIETLLKDLFKPGKEKQSSLATKELLDATSREEMKTPPLKIVHSSSVRKDRQMHAAPSSSQSGGEEVVPDVSSVLVSNTQSGTRNLYDKQSDTFEPEVHGGSPTLSSSSHIVPNLTPALYTSSPFVSAVPALYTNSPFSSTVAQGTLNHTNLPNSITQKTPTSLNMTHVPYSPATSSSANQSVISDLMQAWNSSYVAPLTTVYQSSLSSLSRPADVSSMSNMGGINSAFTRHAFQTDTSSPTDLSMKQSTNNPTPTSLSGSSGVRQNEFGIFDRRWMHQNPVTPVAHKGLHSEVSVTTMSPKRIDDGMELDINVDEDSVDESIMDTYRM